jgi:mono/diheme cytochrome c family protein
MSMKKFVAALSLLPASGLIASFAVEPARPAFTAADAPSPQTDIWRGIFTGTQAKRGDVLYAKHCAPCHLQDMGGREPAPELAGDNFLAKWQGHSVGELYLRVSTTMPAGSPASLQAAEYIDLVALILQANNFRSGSTELSADPAVLNRIQIKKKGD